MLFFFYLRSEKAKLPLETLQSRHIPSESTAPQEDLCLYTIHVHAHFSSKDLVNSLAQA